MANKNGAGAGSIERDARLVNILLGQRNELQAKPHPRKKQVTNGCLRALGPRLVVPGWHSIAAALARKEQPADTAMQAAFRRALEERGRA